MPKYSTPNEAWKQYIDHMAATTLLCIEHAKLNEEAVSHAQALGEYRLDPQAESQLSTLMKSINTSQVAAREALDEYMQMTYALIKVPQA